MAEYLQGKTLYGFQKAKGCANSKTRVVDPQKVRIEEPERWSSPLPSCTSEETERSSDTPRLPSQQRVDQGQEPGFHGSGSRILGPYQSTLHHIHSLSAVVTVLTTQHFKDRSVLISYSPPKLGMCMF